MYKKQKEQQHQVGFASIVAKLAQDLQVVSFFDKHWTFTKEKVEITPGEAILLLIIDAVIHRTPLYRFPERVKEWDVTQLLRRPIKEGAINQFTLGRALDRLYKANPKKVFSELTTQVFAKENISVTSAHSDTSSFVMTGAYEENREQPLVARGHSKDRRPDLKQVKMGLHVQQDGIPFIFEMLRGNLDDKTWSQEMIGDVDHWLKQVQSNQVLLCADAALVTETAIKRLDKTDLLFISRVPSSYVVTTKLKERAFEENNWHPLGAFSDQKEAAIYKCQEYRQLWHGKTRCFLVIWSSSLEKQKKESLEKEKERQVEALEKVIKKMKKHHYSCLTDAERAKKEMEYQFRHHAFEVKGIIKIHEQVKRKPGRPKNGSVPEITSEYIVTLTIGSFKQEWGEHWLQQESTFVLVSNDAKQVPVYTAQELLREYKQQTRVETCFRHLKNPLVIDSFLVEKPERVEAIGYVFMMVLLFSRILEKRVRDALQQDHMPLITIENMKNSRPTIRVLIHLFQGVHVLIEPDGTRWLFEEEWDERRKRALRLMGFTEATFVETTL